MPRTAHQHGGAATQPRAECRHMGPTVLGFANVHAHLPGCQAPSASTDGRRAVAAVTGKTGRSESPPSRIMTGLTLRDTPAIFIDGLPKVHIQPEAESM